MARTAAFFVVALLAIGLASADEMNNKIEKVAASPELSNLASVDVVGDASFSPPQLKTKKAVNIDSLDLAPLSELEPVKKVEEVLAPLKAPLTAISGAPVLISAPPPKDIKDLLHSLIASPPTVMTAVSGAPVAISGAPVAVSGAPIVVAKKPFSLKDKKDSKNLEVPIYNFDLSKDKKSLKDAIGLGRKMF